MTFIENEGYSKDNVYNADETMIFWKTLPRKLLIFIREIAAPGFTISKY